MVNKYEFMAVYKPLLVEDIKEKSMKKVEKLAKSLGGNIEVKDTLGKKLLAYPIGKYKEGYYVLYTLTLDSSKLSEFNKQVKIMDDILRSLAINEENL